jgi:rRNA maturation protein Nop10
MTNPLTCPKCGGRVQAHPNASCKCCQWAICDNCGETLGGPVPNVLESVRRRLAYRKRTEDTLAFYRKIFNHRSIKPAPKLEIV